MSNRAHCRHLGMRSLSTSFSGKSILTRKNDGSDPSQRMRIYVRVNINRSHIFYPRSKGLPQLDGEQSLRLTSTDFFGSYSFPIQATIRETPRGSMIGGGNLARTENGFASQVKKLSLPISDKPPVAALDLDGDRVVVQGYGWLPRWKMPRKIEHHHELTRSMRIWQFLILFFFNELLSEVCPTARRSTQSEQN